MLKTLVETKPTVSLNDWKKHEAKMSQYKKNISMAVPQQYNGVIVSGVYSLSNHNTKRPINFTEARDFIRSKVKSGSLPNRSKFYVHKQHSGAVNSKPFTSGNIPGAKRQ